MSREDVESRLAASLLFAIVVLVARHFLEVR